MSRQFAEARRHLIAYALSYPEAWEDHPWGETVAKVRKKVFVFFGIEDPEGFGLSVKVPGSAPALLSDPRAEPTGYGLGKAGWVSLSFRHDDGDEIPVGLLEDLIDESYRTVAPKRLIARLDEQPPDTVEDVV